MTARLLDQNWHRVKVSKLCMPTDGHLKDRMYVLADYLATRFTATGRYGTKDDDEAFDEAAGDAGTGFFDPTG